MRQYFKVYRSVTLATHVKVDLGVQKRSRVPFLWPQASVLWYCPLSLSTEHAPPILHHPYSSIPFCLNSHLLLISLASAARFISLDKRWTCFLLLFLLILWLSLMFVRLISKFESPQSLLSSKTWVTNLIGEMHVNVLNGKRHFHDS